MNRENELKERLQELWSGRKLEFHPSRIKLGRGICESTFLERPKFSTMLETITDFGIKMDDLEKLHLKRWELEKLYSNIVLYRRTVKYLRGLKDRMI